MNKKIIILSSLIIIFFGFCFCAKAQEDSRVAVPGTMEQAKQKVMDIIRVGREELPQNIKDIWHEEAVPVWDRMYAWYKDNIWSRVQENVKMREPAVKEAFGQEKGEMAEDIKKEAPKFSQYLKILWQEFKNLFQMN